MVMEADELEMRDREALAAIGAVQSYLHDFIISDDCHNYMLLSCMSCQALVLKTQLTMLANDIAENRDLPLIPKDTP